MSVVQYLIAIVRTATRRPFAIADGIATGVGLVIPVAARAFPEFQGRLLDLTWQIPLFTFMGLAAYRTFLAPYWLYTELYRDYQKLQGKAQPPIQMVFSPEPPFVIEKDRRLDSGLNVREVSYRIGLRNEGSQSVDDVKVFLVSIEPLPRHMEEGPILLAYMRGLTLHPSLDRPTHYVEVIESSEYYTDSKFREPNKALNVIVRVPNSSLSEFTNETLYELHLVAEGRDAPPSSARFSVFIDPKKGARFASTE